MRRHSGLITLALILFAVPVLGETAVDQWLVAGPAPIPGSANNGIEASPLAGLFDSEIADPLYYWPSKGTLLKSVPGREMVFQVAEPSLDGGLPAYLLAASYLELETWQSGTIAVKGPHAFRLWVDGDIALERESVDSTSEEMTAELALDGGKRRLLLLVASDGGPGGGMEIVWRPDVESAASSVTLDPKHSFEFGDYYIQESIGDLEISNDGKMLAVIRAKWNRKEDRKENWLEIYDIGKKEKVWEYRGTENISSVSWAPGNSSLLIEISNLDEGSDLFLWDKKDGQLTPLASAVQDASSFLWALDGEGLYYIKSISAEEEENPYKVMWGMMDRWDSWRDRAQIRYLSVDGLSDVFVWEGTYTPDGVKVFPDGKSLLVMRTLPEIERPFEKMELLKIDVATGAEQSLYVGRFQRDGSTTFDLSPDGNQVAFVAGRYEVTGNDNQNPNINDADGDLWILDIASGKARNVALDFEPAVSMFYYGTGGDGELIWHEDGVILFDCVYQKKALLGSYDPVKNRFSTTELTTPGFAELEIASNRGVRTIAYQADRMMEYPEVHVADRRNGKGSRLINLSEEAEGLIGPVANVVDYDYVNSEGVTIPGFLYYPVNFDASKTYPMIIDYYGGVIGFGYGYDWNSQIYAARGYFVYVPVPRGAAGYGHEFANTHPNDWGELSSRDINEGVRHIVAHVPQVDGSKVAPVSGSYGGYLTVYLLAMPKDHPDYYPYATGIAHAGIYDMVDYWGRGDWGFLYNDMASAGSFPWNATEKFIQWSPVYRADNITVPLLISHGDADPNVPPENSEILYTALKTLNRDVVYMHFAGEDHGLASGGKRKTYLISRRIRVEWFDKVLKGFPEAFEWRMKGEMKK